MDDPLGYLPEPHQVECGYLASPASMDNIKVLADFDEWVQAREDYDWEEYSIATDYYYPWFLPLIARKGIAFTWQYQLSEDFSYYAYFFPTEDGEQNIVYFKTGDKRKSFPFLTKRKLNQIETTSAANELLYQLGIKNGTS